MDIHVLSATKYVWTTFVSERDCHFCMNRRTCSITILEQILTSAQENIRAINDYTIRGKTHSWERIHDWGILEVGYLEGSSTSERSEKHIISLKRLISTAAWNLKNYFVHHHVAMLTLWKLFMERNISMSPWYVNCLLLYGNSLM